MNPAGSIYDKCKIVAETSASPCAVMQVERNENGSCKKIIMFAVNDTYSLTGEDVEGHDYTDFIPKEPEFEDMCVRSAFGGEKFHTYVDTSKMLGGWSENIVLPLKFDNDDGYGYCQFLYHMSEDMEPDKFSSISPEIAGFIIQIGLSLRSNNDFDTNIKNVVREIREFTAAKSAIVVSVDFAKRKADILSQNTAPGEIAAEHIITSIPFEIIEGWKRLIGESNCFTVRDRSDFERIEKEVPSWAELLKTEGCENLCMINLSQRGEVIGYLIVTDFPIEKVTTVKETMELLAIIITSEISNNQFLNRLEWLTSVDMLTGVRNRAAMNRAVDEYAAQLNWKITPFGVGFCKMNGLKALNDKNGHDAGNKCLERAGEILREVFDETEVFRSAGEEFAILCENADEKEFSEKIKRLRELGSDPDGVYFAIGCSFDKDTGDIRKALRTASRQMLEEKEEFYKKYPEKKV